MAVASLGAAAAARGGAARSDWRQRRRVDAPLPSPPAALADASRYELGKQQQWLVVKRFVTDAERALLLSKVRCPHSVL